MSHGVVDLHSHTRASDGALTPRELVRLAAAHGVRVLAITDHDSTEGLAEAFEEARSHAGLTIVPGVEINCDVQGGEVHILGYFVDDEADWFRGFLATQREQRIGRVYKIAERLAELGMPIDPREVLELAGEGAAGRPHVAQVLVTRGYVRTMREAFDRYLHANGPANVPRQRLTPVEAVRLIRRARGVPVFAHPGIAGRDAMIPELVSAGMLGIEVYYQEHTPADTKAYLEVCQSFGLVATGGSDYHGTQTGRVNPPGTPAVPEASWEALQQAAERARSA